MKIIGIDLAGSPKNPTGVCVLEVGENDEKITSVRILHNNGEILEFVLSFEKVDIVCVDAPLTFYEGGRLCDQQLHRYGALPITLKGMKTLALRGVDLAGKFNENSINFIEIFSTASAKILGLYDKDLMRRQKLLINSKIAGDTENKILTKDEIDAILAAITGYLHLIDMTETVGDDRGYIVIPRV